MDDEDLLASLQDLSLQDACTEDLELKEAVQSLFQTLNDNTIKSSSSTPTTESAETTSGSNTGYDKTKLLVALLGNIDLVTCAVKKINHLVVLGKRMEQIYRSYYVDSNTKLDLDEIHRLIVAFSDVYNSESYVREVNVTRLYQAYCKKLIEIHEKRTTTTTNSIVDNQNSDEPMII